jgi:hypothetical protein
MPVRHSVAGTDYLGLAYLLLVLAIVFLPVLLCKPAPPKEPPESGPGGGGSPRPPKRPELPPDGLQLLDAQQARMRLRDHGALADATRPRPRRRTPEPDRAPARTGTPH